MSVEFTISLWINITVLQGHPAHIFSNSAITVSNSWNEILALMMYIGGSTLRGPSISPGWSMTPNVGEWYHICISSSTTPSSETNIYVNGQLSGTVTSDSTNGWETSGVWSLGNNNGWSQTHQFQGQIQNISCLLYTSPSPRD